MNMGESEKGRKTRRALRKGWMYLEQIEGRFVDRFHVVHLLVSVYSVQFGQMVLQFGKCVTPGQTSSFGVDRTLEKNLRN